MFSVEGRSVVVTGGSKGIGRGIAEVFVRAGARVLVVGRDGSAARTVAGRLTAAGPGSASSLAADLGTVAGCRAMAQAATDRHGGIDVLCANAGIYPECRLADLTEAQYDAMFDTNVKGTVFAVQACLPALARSGRGRVVIISSITGPITGMIGSAHYGASKAAQLGFIRGAALELADSGVTVNAVLPGNIDTEGLAALGPDYRTAMLAAIPLRRLGTGADIGHAVLFLASDEAAYITGQTLVVDGGQVLPEGQYAPE
jgi:3-oxoacyl-[acyl-carrier protein] reductase